MRYENINVISQFIPGVARTSKRVYTSPLLRTKFILSYFLLQLAHPSKLRRA
jgi:hypothetical protein